MPWHWIQRRIGSHRRRRRRLLLLLLGTLAGAGLYIVFLSLRPAAPFYAIPEGFTETHLEAPGFTGNIFVLQAGMEHNQSVILLHGLGQNASGDWLAAAEALRRHYHVIVPDLPGFGRSRNVAGAGTPRAYAALVATLRDTLGHDHTSLVGHSMGGAVALRYAAAHPDALEKLILVDVAGLLERTAYVKELAELDLDALSQHHPLLERIMLKVEHAADAIVEWINLAPDPLELLRSFDLMHPSAPTPPSQMRIALELLDTDFTGDLAAIRVPTAILWGSNDRIAPMRTAQILQAKISDAMLYTFEEAGHLPMKSDPEAFNRLLLALLDGAAPMAHQAALAPPSAAPLRDLNCTGEQRRVYSGAYDRITIDGCKAVTLRDVTARSLQTRNASLLLENVRIRASEGAAMTAEHSLLVMTDGSIEGPVALRAQSSRIDLAGVSIRAQRGIEIVQHSRLIVSLSDLNSSVYRGSLHGDFSITRSALFDTLIPSAPD